MEQTAMTMEVEQGSIETLRKMIKDVKYALLTTAARDGTLPLGHHARIEF
jgi:hypothetical protein